MGVSPLTPDHVNPERPWPSLDRLRDVTAQCGFALKARLTVHPEYVRAVENDRDATTADVLELMAEGRRRVHERFGVELEPEVQVLGEVEWPQGWQL